jgi:catechol 2,3-dioxygenase-like lactoylglutathione lyase family enzyme
VNLDEPNPTEVLMTSTQLSGDAAAEASGATGVPMRFEVTALPVADVDRAKAFYQRLGWRLDIDFKPSPDTRGVQFTPPGSPASIQFGEGTTTMVPGSLQGMILVVEDIVAARDALIGVGVDVSEIWHLEPGEGPQPGLDPEGRSYFSRASFADPDGNEWQLQQITERLPGRV